MLCFLFAGLIVALDQFFKHWILRTLELREEGPEIIPGILGLTRWENDGAMLNILSGHQWVLAGIAFAAAVVLIMILLRYNEGFWGTLGLAAVLGGTIGNLADRIFNDGKVVDMFRTLFINFPIFNIADVFITLGFITFLIHFIALSFGVKEKEPLIDSSEYISEQDSSDYDEFPDIDAIVSAQADSEIGTMPIDFPAEPEYSQEVQPVMDSPYSPQSQSLDAEDDIPASDYDDINTDSTADSSFSLDALEAELGSLDDYNVDDLLREYGYEEDDIV
jgi:signal peptidase II